MRSTTELWNIIGRPLIKGRKYITDPSKAPKGAKVQRGKRGGYYYEDAGGAAKPKRPKKERKLSVYEQQAVDEMLREEALSRESGARFEREHAKKPPVDVDAKRSRKVLRDMTPVARRAHKLRYGDETYRDEWMMSVMQNWGHGKEPDAREFAAVDSRARELKREAKAWAALGMETSAAEDVRRRKERKG